MSYICFRCVNIRMQNLQMPQRGKMSVARGLSPGDMIEKKGKPCRGEIKTFRPYRARKNRCSPSRGLHPGLQVFRPYGTGFSALVEGGYLG